jgi:CHASE2 domain
MFKTGAQMMILVLLAGLVLMRESRQEPLASWDDRWADFLATTSRQAQVEAPVTLVGIDDASLKDHEWPWTPLDFSLFIQAVLPNSPAVVGTDEVLDWDHYALTDAQLKNLPLYESSLLGQLRLAPRALLGAQLGFPEDPQVAPVWQEVPLLRNIKGDTIPLPDFPIVERQPAEEYRLTSTIGFTNLPRVTERYNAVPLLFRHHGQVVPSFTLQAVMLWSRLTPDEISVELGSHINLGRKNRIPIDARGRMRVDFGTRRGDLTFENLLFLKAKVEAGDANITELKRMKGRVVLISRVDSKARTIPLAAQRTGSPGELFAAAIATIQNRSYIHRAPIWAEVLITALIAFIAWFIPSRTRFVTLAIAFVTLAVYVMLSMAVFNHWLIWLPGVLPTGAVLCFIVFRFVTSDALPKPKKPVIL